MDLLREGLADQYVSLGILMDNLISIPVGKYISMASARLLSEVYKLFNTLALFFYQHQTGRYISNPLDKIDLPCLP